MSYLKEETVLLHPLNLTAEEFEQIGASGLHVCTENFYRKYGYHAAQEHYRKMIIILEQDYSLEDEWTQEMIRICYSMKERIAKITGSCQVL